MERFIKYMFKLMDFGTEAKRLTASLDSFMRDNYIILQKIMTEEDVSVPAFLELYDERTYDIHSKQNDIKYMKQLDFKGIYLIKNLTKKKYYLGCGDKVFRKVDRHFKGYGNQEIFEDFMRNNVFVVGFGRFDSNAYDSIEAYEKESRVYLKTKLDGFQYYRNTSSKQTTKEQDTVNERENIETKSSNRTVTCNKWNLKKKRLKAFLLNGKRIASSVSAVELKGKMREDVIGILTENGFTNIVDEPVRDIYIDSCYMSGEVERVMIDGNSAFKQGEMFPYDAKIEIVFHLKKKLAFPFSPRHVKKNNCYEFLKVLRDVGFTEINLIAIKDLKIGWMVKENSIDRVTIYGKEDYKKGQLLNYDEKIDIYYHTFK